MRSVVFCIPKGYEATGVALRNWSLLKTENLKQIAFRAISVEILKSMMQRLLRQCVKDA